MAAWVIKLDRVKWAEPVEAESEEPQLPNEMNAQAWQR
jgi:hypothetical protein